MSELRPYAMRQWLLPIVLLSATALGLFALAYLFDHGLAGRGFSVAAAWQHYTALDADRLTDAIGQLAPVMVALLGIVVTVVAIIVQLAAGRYAGVARMFLRDRINLLVMAYYVVFGVYGLWLSVGLHGAFVPRITLLLALLAASFGLLLMLPYFSYVFWFLDPTNLVLRIGRSASRAVADAASKRSSRPIDALQAMTLSSMAELADIASNSISGKDNIIASRAVDAFKDFVGDYMKVKDRLPALWFRIGAGIRDNPDFVAMDPESLFDLENRRNWVEWQVLRQYLGIYADALTAMPDIDYLIAIDTRYIGAAAAERGDTELIDLVMRFKNSFLRSTLNARNVRTAYNLLNQYRLLIDALLRQGKGDAALAGVRHMSYYGHVGYDLSLPFVTETVAYDLSSLCQTAHELNAPEQDQMLSYFLDLDRPLRAKSLERALLGVRKAQVKLATYYLSVGELTRAGAIALDMKDEPPERLAAIKTTLAAVVSKDFWEIIDRGHNFEYMPNSLHAQLERFFVMIDRGKARPA